MLGLRSRQAPDAPATMPLRTLAPGSVTGWAAYPAGAAWAVTEAGLPIGGATNALHADPQRRAAPSSSPPPEGATAPAPTQLHRPSGPPPQLAPIACRPRDQ